MRGFGYMDPREEALLAGRPVGAPPADAESLDAFMARISGDDFVPNPPAKTMGYGPTGQDPPPTVTGSGVPNSRVVATTPASATPPRGLGPGVAVGLIGGSLAVGAGLLYWLSRQ